MLFAAGVLHHGLQCDCARAAREDIDTACGRLVRQIPDRARRSERYIAVRQINGWLNVAGHQYVN